MAMIPALLIVAVCCRPAYSAALPDPGNGPTRITVVAAGNGTSQKWELVAHTPEELQTGLQDALLGYAQGHAQKLPSSVTVHQQAGVYHLAEGTFEIYLEPASSGSSHSLVMKCTEGESKGMRIGTSVRAATASAPSASPAACAAPVIAEIVCQPWVEQLARERHKKWQDGFMGSPDWAVFRRVTSRAGMPSLAGIWRAEPEDGYVHFTDSQFCHLDAAFSPMSWYRTPNYVVQENGDLWLHYGVFAETMKVLADGDRLILMNEKSDRPQMLLTRVPMTGPHRPAGLMHYLATADVESSAFACQRMKWDVDRYPKSLDELLRKPKDAAELWHGPYLREIPPADPWGRPYRYRGPSEKENGFEVWSLGADGKAGGTGDNADYRHRETAEEEQP